MSYAHLFENCDHVIEGNILLDIASIPPVLKKALIFLIQSGLEREAFNAQLTELLIYYRSRIVSPPAYSGKRLNAVLCLYLVLISLHANVCIH